jgi:hypothetical protein
VSAWPEPPSVIPAEWPVGPTAEGISERNTELASIHHKGTPVPPSSSAMVIGTPIVSGGSEEGVGEVRVKTVSSP